MLNTTIIGSGTGTPVLLAHGLFGLGRNLGGIARRLADQGHRVISVDMRNHGQSFHDSEHGYPALAADLAHVIDVNGGRADVVGHSMGGKAGMTLALTRPELVARLSVLDIAPVAYGHDQTAYLDAMEELDLQGLERRSIADERLAGQVQEPGIRAFLLQSLDLKAQPPRWTLNLSALRSEMSTLVGWCGDDLMPGAFTGPALFLAGAQSDYVDKAGEAEIVRLFPQARIERIRGAGHWLHADQPVATAEAVAAFLNRA